MLILEAVERQLCAVMEALVEAAVAELSGLLQRGSADGESAERSEEDRDSSTAHITDRFSSLMEVLTKTALEKLRVILKVSMCDPDDAAQQRHDEPEDGPTCTDTDVMVTQETRKPTGTSGRKRSQTEEGFRTSRRKTTDHMYCRGELKTEILTAESEPAMECADVVSHEEVIDVPPSEPQETEAAVNATEEDEMREDTNASDASHTNNETTAGRFKCGSCEKTFARRCLMARHHLTHSKPHLCSECGKRFSGLRGLVAHSRRHTGEKPHKCSECGTEFAYKSTFLRHMRQHRARKLSAHTCALCEREFEGLAAFQRHQCAALRNTFACSLCPQTFQCRRRLADHENQHSGERDFVCEMCGERFLSRSSLTTHRVTHTQAETCCSVLGSSDPAVRRIHSSKHTGEKLFVCQVCGKGCGHQTALQQHMITHTGERRYVCQTCGKRCSHASALQNHLRTHTGQKPGQPHACEVCGKQFRRSVRLKYHMSSHTGVKPHACDSCGKTFASPHYLSLHKKIHQGQKPYGCTVCGRRFVHFYGLKLHTQLHSGDGPRCLVCGKVFTYNHELKKHAKEQRHEEAEEEEAVRETVTLPPPESH